MRSNPPKKTRNVITDTFFAVHTIPGECGMCGKSFETPLGTQYFCEKCRSKPIKAWGEWMQKKNEEARKKLK